MKLGVAFPQTEIGLDPIVIRDYAQAAEGLGYKYLLALDHILGPDVTDRPDWAGFLNANDQIHEVFVLFGHLAAVTTTLEFFTGILVLPMRQTALVAKQAAEIDVLSGGRLTLGLGVGYNKPEYEAVGADFSTRGRLMEEQIHVLRLLWTQQVVDFKGKFHHIDRAGINPMPIQRPIPLFMGGANPRVLERTARLADGWIPSIPSPGRPTLKGFYVPQDMSVFSQTFAKMKEDVRANGKNPDTFEVRGPILHAKQTPDAWLQDMQAKRDLGFNSLHVVTTGLSMKARDHIKALENYMEVVKPVL